MKLSKKYYEFVNMFIKFMGKGGKKPKATRFTDTMRVMKTKMLVKFLEEAQKFERLTDDCNSVFYTQNRYEEEKQL